MLEPAISVPTELLTLVDGAPEDRFGDVVESLTDTSLSAVVVKPVERLAENSVESGSVATVLSVRVNSVERFEDVVESVTVMLVRDVKPVDRFEDVELVTVLLAADAVKPVERFEDVV